MTWSPRQLDEHADAQPGIGGCSSKRASTLKRSMARSKVTTIGALAATPTSPLDGSTRTIEGDDDWQDAVAATIVATPAARPSRVLPTAAAVRDLAHVVGQRGQLGGVDEHDGQLRDAVQGGLHLLP